jgi:hypothetical protein
MTQRVAPNQRRTFRVNRTAVISIFLLLALFAAACSEDGEGPTSIPGDVTTPTSPDATQPPDTTQPPATTEAPATTQAPATTEAPTDESDEGIPVEVWIVLGLVAAVAILAGVLIGRGRSSSGSTNGTESGDGGGSAGGAEPGDSDGSAGGTG